MMQTVEYNNVSNRINSLTLKKENNYCEVIIVRGGSMFVYFENWRPHERIELSCNLVK